MSPGEAAEWLRSKAREFRGLGPRILDAQHRAAVVAGRLPQGSPERADARRLVVELGKSLTDHQTTLNRWDALVARLPFLAPDDALGILPVIPLAVAGTVVAVATSMALIFRRLDAEERAVRLLERGRITPAEAVQLTRSIEGGRRPLFGIPWWLIALGVGGYFVAQRAR